VWGASFSNFWFVASRANPASNLKEFAERWDSLVASGKSNEVTIISPRFSGIYLVGHELTDENLQAVKSVSTIGMRPKDIVLGKFIQGALNSSEDFAYRINVTDTEAVLRAPKLGANIGFPESAVVLVISPLKQITGSKLLSSILAEERISVASAELSRFAETFTNLVSVSRLMEHLSFPELKTALRAESERSMNYFEALGMKIPSNAIAKWGALIVLAVQIYLNRHLRFMSRYYLAGIYLGRAAWIALYDDRLSRISVGLTMSILPIVTVAALGRHEARISWSTGIILVISALLGASTFLEIQSLWRKLARRSHSKAERDVGSVT
jgi:hypothetical protein